MTTTDAPPPGPGFATALRFWLLLGCISFGGPAGQIAIMHAELVDKRRWIDEASFLRGLNVCMLLPGPEAMQLATWLGWRLHGLRGGLAAGALFVLPAALLLLALSALYVRHGDLAWVDGVAFGLQAAVLGLIAHALQRIGARVLKAPFALLLAAASLGALLAGVAFPLILLGAAAAGAAAWRWRPHWLPQAGHGAASTAAHDGRRPALRRAVAVAAGLLAAWWAPLLALGASLGPDSTAWAMATFFSRTALVTLGGAYAVLPYVAQHAVHTHGWVDAGQMMTGLGLAEATPGPLVLVLQFIGFVGAHAHPDLASPLASGALGAAVALWATFLPSFLFVLTLAPWIDRGGSAPWAQAMLGAITAAVVGVIAHLALWFGATLLSAQGVGGAVAAVAIAVAAWWVLARRGWPVYVVVPVAGAMGAALRLAGAA